MRGQLDIQLIRLLTIEGNPDSLAHNTEQESLMIISIIRSNINNNTDAGLNVVIKLVGEHINTITLCVCVYVHKTPEAGSLVVLSTRKCCLLLNKYGLRMSLQGNSTLEQAHTHTQGYCVYMLPYQFNDDMQTNICIVFFYLFLVFAI